MSAGDLFPEVINSLPPPERMARRVPPPGSSPSWFTPVPWFLGWEHELLQRRAIPRPFDLDPFGHPEAPVSRLILARGGTVYTGRRGLEDDGLVQPWTGRVAFVNPPYDSELMELAAPKVTREIERADVGALLPAWTDRQWWHRSGIERLRLAGIADVRFIQGRLTFGWPEYLTPEGERVAGNPDGDDAETAKFTSCTIVFRGR